MVHTGYGQLPSTLMIMTNGRLRSGVHHAIGRTRVHPFCGQTRLHRLYLVFGQDLPLFRARLARTARRSRVHH